MLEESLKENFLVEDIFELIQVYHQLNFSYFLKAILKDKKVSVVELYKKLKTEGYYLSLESLYRYFNSSQKSNRFPPRDFIEVFAETLKLTNEQAELLLQFWTYSKILKKHK